MSRRRPSTRSLLGATCSNFRSSWQALVLTDVAYKLVAFILLTPVVGILFQIFVALSGRSILADHDILYFVVSPIGWICMVAVGTVWLGIAALELAALIGIIAAATHSPIGPWGALRFASSHAWPVFKIAALVLCYVLAAMAPFMAVAGVIYATLLTEHNINYYLAEKPPALLIAVGLGCVLVAGSVVVLLRLLTSWFFALPIVVCEEVPTSRALRISSERARGHRRALMMWIVGWAIGSFVLSTVAIAIVIGIGRFLVPLMTGSLVLTTITIGAVLALSTVVALVANLFSTTIFAAMLVELYWQLGSQDCRIPVRLEASAARGGSDGFQMSRKWLLVAGIVAIAVAAFVGASALTSVRLEDDTEIVAHRAGAAAAPENTMAAAKQAIADSADWIEIDVQETADGEVVVLHDSDFMRLAKLDKKIWEATFEDLKDLDIGGWYSPEFTGERVPTLRDMLVLCKDKVGVNIELKHYGHDDQLEQRVIDLVEAEGMDGNVVVMSMERKSVTKMKSLRPNWKVGLLSAVAVGDLVRQDADFLAVSVKIADREFVQSAHAAGKEVQVWTVNDAATMSVMIGRGVDYLITDEPAMARAVLVERAKMGVVQRLLLESAEMLGVQPDIGDP